MSASSTKFETSTNWSGAYVTSNRFKKFVQIWGFWRVPEHLDLPPLGKTVTRPGLPYTCSNWIGLDGQRRYFNSSLPQMGTSQLCYRRLAAIHP